MTAAAHRRPTASLLEDTTHRRPTASLLEDTHRRPTASLLEDTASALACSTRAHGNVSLVVGTPELAARHGLAALVGAGPHDLVFMQQVHGNNVAVVGAADRGRGLDGHGGAVPDVDALVTFDCGVALVVLVADCVPVLLSDPGGSVAAVHAGRRGVAAGIVAAALAGMQPEDPAAVTAWIGPAIGPCCYEVPADLADAVPAARATTTWGAPSLDLPGAVASQLAALGVRDVSRSGACTRCHADAWFSHRASADGAAPGRFAAVVVRHGDAAPARSGGDPSIHSP